VARLAIQLKLTKNIQGVAEYDPADTIVDVAQQLPPNSYMVMLYSPIDSQKGLIKNAINQMMVDRSIQEVDRNGMLHSRSRLILYSILLILAPPWPPSTTEDDKLSQILEHIKKLDRKVNVQDGVIAQLKDDNAALKVDNAALKVRVGILEEDNQVLREAIDGVSTFA